ncbi:hypothetical protein GE09DRAFT_106717 [Coniochaeta sp. 2T2.1]|nr:hypothetical protein GE09DRAFT_106717 [Coniochaeta sp. 2T2.1]
MAGLACQKSRLIRRTATVSFSLLHIDLVHTTSNAEDLHMQKSQGRFLCEASGIRGENAYRPHPTFVEEGWSRGCSRGETCNCPKSTDGCSVGSSGADRPISFFMQARWDSEYGWHWRLFGVQLHTVRAVFEDEHMALFLSPRRCRCSTAVSAEDRQCNMVLVSTTSPKNDIQHGASDDPSETLPPVQDDHC